MSRITSEILKQLFPFTPASKRDRWIEPLNVLMAKYGIATELRAAAFLATIGIESDHLKTFCEYASGWAYDISRDPKKARGLGNLEKGDGPRYKGGGAIQYTGKNNHRKLTERVRAIYPNLEIDFVAHPEILKTDIRWAVESACIFWVDHNLNRLADTRQFFAVSGIVNRGDAAKKALAFDERRGIYERALRLLPENFRLGGVQPPDMLADNQDSDLHLALIEEIEQATPDEALPSRTRPATEQFYINTVTPSNPGQKDPETQSPFEATTPLQSNGGAAPVQSQSTEVSASEKFVAPGGGEGKIEIRQNTFSAESFKAYIPQIETFKSYLRKTFAGTTAATALAFIFGMPVWLQIALTVLVMIVVTGGIIGFIKYHKEIFAFVTQMNIERARADTHNPEVDTL